MQLRQVAMFSFQLPFFISFALIVTLATAQIIPTNTTSPPPTTTRPPPTNTTSLPPNATPTITKAATITKPGCPQKCGNLTVPYPFGIGLGSGCALNSNFEINCVTNTTGFSTPFIWNIPVYEISDAEMRISSTINRRCYSSTGMLLQNDPAWMSLGTSSPYSFSTLNRFTVVGCDEAAIIFGSDFANGCPTVCISPSNVAEGRCMGAGCCQIPIPKGLKFFNTTMQSSKQNHTGVWSFNPCGYSFLGEASRFQFKGLQDLSDLKFVNKILGNVPIVLDWAIGTLRCAEAHKSNDYACLNNSQCVDSDTSLGGYRCSCNPGYEGNPYIGPGCQDLIHHHKREFSATKERKTKVLLYVDDMLAVGHNACRIQKLKQELSKSFSMKDLGLAKQILDMQIVCDRKSKKLWLSQEKYIHKVLRRFNMDKAKVVSTPLVMHFKLSMKQCPSSDDVCNGKPILCGHTDSDMAGDVNTPKSTLGYLITFIGGAVSWQSRLQKCIALSTTEAELIAVIEACKELL
ncbi:putative wall-associated receptor kinase 2-like [Capsicum annuum]|nr:putative wall-associated receptor kinase 2-like [Capsicum annuum]KAF3665473.1 putative wall-associated receptor kinase 2-like [Capsicum annuum]